MKKMVAVIFVLITAGWAFYLYGYGGYADAKAKADAVYARDPDLSRMVERLETLNADLRRQIDLLEHAEKKRTDGAEAGMPPAALKKSLRDPFLILP